MHRACEETPFEALSDGEQQLLEVFAQHNVHVVVVGGYAIRAHGHLRDVGDLDLVIETTQENLDKLQKALAMLGSANAAEVTLLFEMCPKAKWRWRDGYLDH